MSTADTSSHNAVPGHRFAPGSSHQTLDIAIVGAGIAGLSAAIGLCRSGHNVEVFERSRFSNEIGAAINVCPNATGILREWDFDFVRSRSLVAKNGRFLNGLTLEPTLITNYDDVEEKYGEQWFFLHRVDLHTELTRLALEPGRGIKGAKINLLSKVVDVNCELGVLTLADASTHKKDLIIVADGVHSVAVEKVTGIKNPARPTGSSAFRFLVPTEKLLRNKITRSLFENVPVSMDIATLSDRRFIWYPCRNGELQNFVAIIPNDAASHESESGWRESASIQDINKLNEICQDFHPMIREICSMAEDLKLWPLLYRAPIASWVKDKVVLIGDAAHPMLPLQGQGGSQAIEDGAALGVLLSNFTNREALKSRLQLFEDVRRPRASAIQIFSNTGQDQASLISKEAELYVKGPIPTNPQEVLDFIFSHKAIEESLAMLNKSEE